jgi:hypothetical protein
MSSSISSSEAPARGRTLRIALLILAALLLIEWGTRSTVVPGSSDLHRYRSFPERARDLVAAPAPRIALVGNSVTDRVQIELLQREWTSVAGQPLAADKFVAYYSNLATWYWMIDRYFLEASLAPDLIVVTYYDKVGLADAPLIEVGTLAQFFTGPDDLAELFQHDIRTLEQRVGYLLSSVSTAFATRDRIRDRALNFIPGYRPFATTVNARQFEHERRLRMATVRPAATFETLRRLVTRAQQAGVQLCFVAFRPRPVSPDSPGFEIDPAMLEVIADAGMLHLDLRDMNELTADLYQDNVHLNARGASIYTQRLAQELDRTWQPR